MKGKFGSIRFLGKLRNNAKAGNDLWLGIEWDEEGSGRHNGTVDGETYFSCQFHVRSPNFLTGQTQCCSFIRYGKVSIGGISLSEAIEQKYKPDHMLTEEEKKVRQEKEQAELYVNTAGSKGFKKIEILGLDKAYMWRADVVNSRDISLESMRISSLGPPNTIKDCIPGTFNLYLDKNLLYSWD